MRASSFFLELRSKVQRYLNLCFKPSKPLVTNLLPVCWLFAAIISVVEDMFRESTKFENPPSFYPSGAEFGMLGVSKVN